MLISLESNRKNILKERDEVWRIKRKSIKMASGDDNTKKIQDFEKGRKQQNMIWELRNDNNQQVSTFEEIADIEKMFFLKICSKRNIMLRLWKSSRYHNSSL